ncbi:MAG TPA: thioredoxin-dependent thiol peroxidase [Gaiellales bacterium]|jgi:peroxiredoxin Q/BCP|nr:thioredoxin-dependent thiol peroxidase [Gaiellales bacterium]
MVEPGQPAPDFALVADSGETVRLSDLRGRPVVVYFYPKDDTPGCTRQACDIRDRWGDFARAGADVVGISPDATDSHQRFKEKHALPFPLLSDEDHAVAEAYGAWGEKQNYGRTYFGIIRSGFVIDGDGVVVAAKRNIKADKHREWALAELERLAERTAASR